MNEKELIEEVILEIKRQFGGKLPSEKPAEISFDKSSGKRAAVIGSMTKEEEKIFRASYKEASWKDNDDYEILMIARMSIPLMVETVLGLPGCGESMEILNALLNGKEVYVLENGIEYRKYRCTAVKTLYHLYQEYEEKMKRLGIQILSHTLEIPKNNWAERCCDMKADFGSDCLKLTDQRLIRESDLMKAKSKGCAAVMIDSRAIITPLAADYLTNHDLQVRRSKR